MINKTFPGTIDESKVSKKPKNVFESNLNHDLCLEGAKAIGCSTINIGAGDLREGKQHLVMGLLWQVIKVLSRVTQHLMCTSLLWWWWW
jgi:plastin-1